MPPTTKSSNECVQVVVRCRPLNSTEKSNNNASIVSCIPLNNQISIQPPTGPPKDFTFDAVYPPDAEQKAFYEESCYNLVESVMEGFNGTIFAYGQTGCGKTHTMQGLPTPEALRGVIPRSFDHVFEAIRITTGVQFLVRCSYLEIYNEEIRDLLGKNPSDRLELKEDPGKGVFVKGLTEIVVEDENTINEVMEEGLGNRSVAATAMNATSSRSHAIFTMWVEASEVDERTQKEMIRVGKLNLVDLAGSERQKKTGASGDRLKEGSKINLSLSALGNVISALVDGKGKHIPYRDSKLTRLLQDSLGGNTKTLMVAAVSPADYNFDETTSTLRYANRAKNIKNKPKINEDPKDAMLREYKEEIEKLKQMLLQQNQGGGVDVPPIVAADARPAPPGQAQVRERVVEVEKEKIVVKKEYVEMKNEKMYEEALQYNQSILDQRNQLGSELDKQKREREELERRIRKMQKKMLGNSGNFEEGSGHIDPENLIKTQKAKERHEKLRLKAKKKKEKLLEQEKQRMMLEKQEKEEELEGALEEMERVEKKHAREKNKLKKKLKEALMEIEDLKDEFDRERESMFETVREQGKELKLWEQVSAHFLDRKQINRVWEKSEWNVEIQEWKLPRLKLKKGFEMHVSGAGGNGKSDLGSLPSLEKTSPRINAADRKPASRGSGAQAAAALGGGVEDEVLAAAELLRREQAEKEERRRKKREKKKKKQKGSQQQIKLVDTDRLVAGKDPEEEVYSPDEDFGDDPGDEGSGDLNGVSSNLKDWGFSG